MPYSVAACRAAAQGVGLQLGGGGHEFEGNYAQKGCYAYSSGRFAGMAYYGLGGSDSEISDPMTNSEQKYRPSGWDCTTSKNLQFY